MGFVKVGCWAPSGRTSTAVNDAGAGGEGERGIARVHDVGRSRVIHMLWNGFLSGPVCSE